LRAPATTFMGYHRAKPGLRAAAKAIHRFEVSTGFRSFKKFHVEQASAFRRRLDEADGDKPLSKATVLQTFNALRAFFLWLAEQLRQSIRDAISSSADRDKRIQFHIAVSFVEMSVSRAGVQRRRPEQRPANHL
jgi:hypothetical protein